jgi:hypothetical protein
MQNITESHTVPRQGHSMISNSFMPDVGITQASSRITGESLTNTQANTSRTERSHPYYKSLHCETGLRLDVSGTGYIGKRCHICPSMPIQRHECTTFCKQKCKGMTGMFMKKHHSQSKVFSMQNIHQPTFRSMKWFHVHFYTVALWSFSKPCTHC